MPKYIIHVNEIHRAGYIVEAESEEEAVDNFFDLGDGHEAYSEWGYVIRDDYSIDLLEDELLDRREDGLSG